MNTTPPDYATRKIQYPKWNGRVSLIQEPRVLRRISPGVSKENANNFFWRAREMYHTAKNEARALRRKAGDKYGCGDGPNSYPISGGICEHWPRVVSDQICGKEQDSNTWWAVAYAWHKYQGKRHETFDLGFNIGE